MAIVGASPQGSSVPFWAWKGSGTSFALELWGLEENLGLQIETESVPRTCYRSGSSVPPRVSQLAEP